MTQTVSLRVEGMCCAEEVSALRREVESQPGVVSLSFDLLSARMNAVIDPSLADADALARAVARTGMRATPWQEAPPAASLSLWRRHGRVLLTAVSGLLTAAASVVHLAVAGGSAAALRHGESPAAPLTLSIGLCMAAVAAGLWPVIPRAWAAARRLRPDMNLLMSTATISAAAIGEWLEAASVASLYSLALLLESWSVGRARRAVQALLDLTPPVAHVLCCHAEDRPVAQVRAGERILVKPGERIPLDGTVEKGESAVDQAPITGESIPVDKAPGSEVFAGTVNGAGALEIRVVRPADQTLLARMVHLVQESQSRRGEAEQWTDRFARVYTPLMMLVSALIMAGGPIATGGALTEWLYRGLVILVIACPCALVISTPVSVVAALACAARRGVLIKGGLHLETPARLRAVALDKTGTLTRGQPRVERIVPLNGHTGAGILARAAALEAHSEHPLGRAIVDHAAGLGLAVPAAADHRRLSGRGAEATVDGRRLWIGSHRLLRERGLATPESDARARELEDAGHTVVGLGTGDHVCGLIGIADAVRPEAAPAIAQLRALGVRHVALLTGDNGATAGAIARETGVDEAFADLLPEDKVAAIETLLVRHGAVAMVGDGVNDAPAMARASLGIAMGAAGSGTAIETADIALMADDLTALPWLVRHSRRALRIIRQNVVFALGLKIVFLALAVPGWATLWMAIVADMGASLLVIANGLRLLRPAP